MLPVLCALNRTKMRLQILCIVTVITAGVVSGNFCEAGWFSYKHFCYKNDTSKFVYWQARKKCQDMGADLTTMSDAEETEALRRSLQNVTGTIDLWIGLYNPVRVKVGGNSSGFKWTDGTSFNSSYDIWFGSGDAKEPNRNERCGRFYRANERSPVTWATTGETAKKGFICKKETWDPTSEHCLEDKCYKISASTYDNENEARQECLKNNMTVLKHGQFPDSLNQTYPLDGSTPFWLDNGNQLEHQGVTPAWVICTGPSEKTCPCGWHGLDNFCYYLGVAQKLKSDANQTCYINGGKLAMIRSHTENKFIKSVVNASQRYWIRNGRYADYCYDNANLCHNDTVIQETWKSTRDTEENYFICKKRKDDLSSFDFCLDGYSGECYNSSQKSVPPRNLNGASCVSGMQILSEQMVKDRNISRNIAKAIMNSAPVSCHQYLIKSDSGPKLLYAKNNAEIELKDFSSNNEKYHYICVKDMDECLSSPCKNSGTCLDKYHNVQCNCLPGYTGKQCETGQSPNLVNVVLGTLLALSAAIIMAVAAYFCVRRNSTHSASSRPMERDQGLSAVDVHAYEDIEVSGDHGLHDDVTNDDLLYENTDERKNVK